MYQQADIDEKVRELILFLCWCTEEQRTDFFHAIFREFCQHCGSGDGYNCNCGGRGMSTAPPAGQPVHIGDRMLALIDKLQEEGIGGVTFPDIASERSGEWNADYAIVRYAYCPYVLSDDHDYFDHARLLSDFRKFVEQWFAGDDSVTVVFNIPDGSNEIEVCRKSPSVAKG